MKNRKKKTAERETKKGDHISCKTHYPPQATFGKGKGEEMDGAGKESRGKRWWRQEEGTSAVREERMARLD